MEQFFDPTVSALDVANTIFDVVEWLHKTHHVTFIAVSQLFWRFAKPDPSKGRPLSPEVYNAKVAEGNSILEVILLIEYSVLWRNKGLFANPSDFLTTDQVHLNVVGNQRLYLYIYKVKSVCMSVCMLPIGDQSVRPTHLICCMDIGIIYKTDMANLKIISHG